MNVISVVIPVYNEQQSISSVLDEVKAVLDDKNVDYEIIVVDDGSNDNTAQVVQDKGTANLVHHPHNRGYGASLKTGISRSSGDVILIMDGDGTYRAKYIPELLDQMGEYDTVVGARTGTNVRIPLSRRPAKWFLSKLANYLAGVKIPDINSGMRVFKRADIERFVSILPPGFSFTTTLTLAYHCNDYLIKYVPIDYHERVGKSKIRPFKDGKNFILLILRAKTYFNPLRVFMPFAFIFLVYAVLLLV